jgi:predicted transcriptional regulator of viral defense system
LLIAAILLVRLAAFADLPRVRKIHILVVCFCTGEQVMRSAEFFETHPVFTHDEYVEARAARGATRRTSSNLLMQHVKSGRLARVRRGLYAVVPRGLSLDATQVDPYLVASKLAPDATVAYHAALQFYGKAYSVWSRFHYFTRLRARRLVFRGSLFLPVQWPAAVRDAADGGGGVAETRHGGGVVRVSTLERALVDVLDAPEKCGGWEEVWRSLEMIEFLDLDAVIDYVQRLGSALTAARVGLFLEQHQAELMVEEQQLRELSDLSPRQVRYLDAQRQPGHLVRRWNLIVPEQVIDRVWEREW